MKKAALFSIFLVFALAAKLSLEPRFPDRSTRLPANLEPLQASYESASLKKYAFGFDNLIGGILWVQLLQSARHDPVKSDAVSWEYAQLDGITELDPRLEDAFEFGSVFLSTFRRDKLGGQLLLEKWVKRRPNYWKSRYMLGLHHFLQKGDKATAGPLILQASRMNNAPVWISSLGIRLMSETGAVLQSLKLAVELLPAIQDPMGKERLVLRIRSLNYNLQKKYLGEIYEEFNKNGRQPASLTELQPKLREKSQELASAFADTRLSPEAIGLLREKFDFTWNAKARSAESTEPEIEKLLGQVGAYQNTESHNGK